MVRTLTAEIVTPESILYTNEVQMVVATTPAGELGILPLHEPLVTTLAPGEVRFRYGDTVADWEFFSVSGGYLQVREDKVIVLADEAISVSQIDPVRVRESVERVRERIKALPLTADDERSQYERELYRREVELRVVERHGQ